MRRGEGGAADGIGVIGINILRQLNLAMLLMKVVGIFLD